MNNCVVWKDIPMYEGMYQISNYGECRSLDRICEKKNGTIVKMKGKILKPKIDKDGYLKYELNNRTPKYYFAHRLVMLSFNFINNHDEMQVNHINGNKQDNFTDNLEWCDCSHNNKHAFKIGLNKIYGDYARNRKINSTIAIAIYEEYHNTKSTCEDLSKKYDLSRRHINDIVLLRRWERVILEHLKIKSEVIYE